MGPPEGLKKKRRMVAVNGNSDLVVRYKLINGEMRNVECGDVRKTSRD